MKNKEKIVLNCYKYKYKYYGWNPIFCMVMRIKHKALKRNPNVTSFEEMIKAINIQYYNDFFSCVNITQHGNLVGLKYNLQTTPKDMWDNPNSPYRECRSIVIDIKNEKIVMCPFRKFFNLDEVEENKLNKVRIDILKSNHFEITNKLDGSMQCATYYNGEILLTGSSSINPETSWRIKDGYSMLDESYKVLIKSFPNYTFIFEYISKKDVHVVNYSKEQEGLYLIGIRHNTTGIELSYLEVITLAHKYNVKVVEMEHLTLNELLKEMKIAKCDEKEGWVLNIDGHKIKIKTDDYVNMHRLFGVRISPNIVIESIADGDYDDFYAKVPEAQKEFVANIKEQVTNYVNKIESRIDFAYDNLPKGEKKDIMIYIQNNVDKDIRKYVISKYLGQEYNILKSKNGRYSKASEIGIEEEI